MVESKENRIDFSTTHHLELTGNRKKIICTLYDAENVKQGSIVVNDDTDIRKYKRFLSDLMIKLPDVEIKTTYNLLIKVINAIKVIKEDKGKEEEDFFSFISNKEKNQFIYKGELAYSLCNGFTKIILTKDNCIDITNDEEWNHIEQIESIRLSTKGYEKWKNKEINVNIFIEVKDWLKKYIWFEKEEEYDLIAVFIFHTYLFNLQGNTVYLHFNGEAGCGKTTAQKFIQKLSWNGELITHLTESALFRLVEALQSTLNIDEIDKWNADHQISMQGIMNNGYSKGGYVLRTEPTLSGQFRTRKLMVFSPKTISTNNPYFLSSFKDRCIEIIMQISNKHLLNIDCPTDEDTERFINLRDDIIIYMLHRGIVILNRYKEIINDSVRTSNRSNQLLGILKCFIEQFNLDNKIEEYVLAERESKDNVVDLNFIILECLALECTSDFFEITITQICTYVNTVYKEYYDSKSASKVTIGLRMKQLGFKSFKKQNKGSVHKQHFRIPTAVVKEVVNRHNYDIEFPIIKPNNVNNPNNPNKPDINDKAW